MQKDIRIGLALLFSMLLVLFGMRLLRESGARQNLAVEPDELKITRSAGRETYRTRSVSPPGKEKQALRTTGSAQGSVLEKKRSLTDQADTLKKSKDEKEPPDGTGDKLAGKLKDLLKRAGFRAPAPSAKYAIKPGDTLFGIAKEHYNNGSKWRVIFEANRKTIKDPDKLPVGLVITIPPLPGEKTGSPGPTVKGKTRAAKRTVMEYTVREGDTLGKISKKFLGSPVRYREILQLNTAKIRDPDLIYPGQVILIPLDKRQ